MIIYEYIIVNILYIYIDNSMMIYNIEYVYTESTSIINNILKLI